MSSLTNPPSAELVATARATAKLSQEEAAAVVHKTPRAWRYWENGDRQMDLTTWELFLIKTDQHPKMGLGWRTDNVKEN